MTSLLHKILAKVIKNARVHARHYLTDAIDAHVIRFAVTARSVDDLGRQTREERLTFGQTVQLTFLGA